MLEKNLMFNNNGILKQIMIYLYELLYSHTQLRVCIHYNKYYILVILETIVSSFVQISRNRNSLTHSFYKCFYLVIAFQNIIEAEENLLKIFQVGINFST